MNKYNINDNFSYSLGMSLTIEALKHKACFVKQIILSSKANKNEQLDYLLDLCKQNNIEPIYDDKTIEKLSIKENCYCIGVFDKFYSDLSSNKHIVLYRFNDFGELGTILRSSICFDFKDIVLIGSDIDYFDPRCIRASMGSIFHTNIVRFNSIEDYINKYPKQNIIPFISKSDNELNNLKLNDNYSLIIPQDYFGLDKEYKKGYCISHNNLDEISLSVRSSIILEYAYNQNRNL